MKYFASAKQINTGYFVVEADSPEEAKQLIDEMIEDDFVRETGEWEIGEVELA